MFNRAKYYVVGCLSVTVMAYMYQYMKIKNDTIDMLAAYCVLVRSDNNIIMMKNDGSIDDFAKIATNQLRQSELDPKITNRLTNTLNMIPSTSNYWKFRDMYFVNEFCTPYLHIINKSNDNTLKVAFNIIHVSDVIKSE